jgi:hypothetical protein
MRLRGGMLLLGLVLAPGGCDDGPAGLDPLVVELEDAEHLIVEQAFDQLPVMGRVYRARFP